MTRIAFWERIGASDIFSGVDGFLGTRGSLMMDFVVLAMVGVVILLGWSVYLVKRGSYVRHKQIQIVLGVTLLLAVTAFEIDIQYLSKWRERADPSPYFDQLNAWSCPAGVALIIHLCFAVPSALLWVYVIVGAPASL